MSKELEEAAERYVEQITTTEFGEAHNAPHRVKSFIAGANWQQERMYSEEELIGNEENSLDTFLLNSSDYTQEERELIMEAVVEWFEQIKKK